MRLIDADELIKKWEVPKALPIPFADLICDAVIDAVKNAPTAETDLSGYSDRLYRNAYERGKAETLSKVIRCRECKHFELDHFEKTDEFPIPIIVAHEVCMKWGDGCRTSLDGWCFMAERREDE